MSSKTRGDDNTDADCNFLFRPLSSHYRLVGYRFAESFILELRWIFCCSCVCGHSASPLVGGDISLFGEITPVVMAGLIIALMPKTSSVNYIAAFLAFISYILFVHLSWFFLSGPGVGLISLDFDKIAGPQKTILSLVSNIRIMVAVILASILGFKIRK